MSYGYGRVDPEVWFFVGTAVLVLGLGAVAIGPNCYRSTMARYDVSATVVKSPEAKIRLSSEGGGDSKFSVTVVAKDDTGCHKKIVNCTSTQCASLAAGDGVAFSCFDEWHWFEPNEEECRFEKLDEPPCAVVAEKAD